MRPGLIVGIVGMLSGSVSAGMSDMMERQDRIIRQIAPPENAKEEKPKAPPPELPRIENPEKFPSLGFTYNYSPLHGSGLIQGVSRTAKFKDSLFMTDVRIPISGFWPCTLKAGLGYRTIDQGDQAVKLKGAAYSAEARFYFK